MSSASEIPPVPAATPVPGWGAIVFAVAVASLAGVLFGYDTGVASGIQGYLQSYFHLSNAQLGFAIASLDIGCILGALLAGPITDRFGRKKVLLLCAVLFIISGLWSALPRFFWELVLARILGGLAIGASSMIAPVYICEIAPEKHRGRLAALFQLGIVIGIAVVYWVNYFIQSYGSGMAALAKWNQQYGWRWMLGSEAVPALLFLILLIFVTESPRWLVVRGRESQARDILTRFFGAVGAEREIHAVKEVAAQEEGRWRELLTAAYRLPLFVALFLAVFSQFSGINSIIYYAPRVFGAAGMQTTSAFGSTALVGMVNLLFTFVAVAYVDKWGRKLLLTMGTAIQVLALGSVGVIFALAQRSPLSVLAPGRVTPTALLHFSQGQVVLLLISVLVFIAAFAIALGPIPWIVISEIFPARIRGRAASTGVLTLWAAVFVVAQTFPMLKHSLGLTATYFIYAGCSLLTCLFAAFVLPETKGRTLEEIEAYWRRRHLAAAPGSPAGRQASSR